MNDPTRQLSLILAITSLAVAAAACDGTSQNQKGLVTSVDGDLVCVENADTGELFCVLGSHEVLVDAEVGDCVQVRSDFDGVSSVDSDPRLDPERLESIKPADGC